MAGLLAFASPLAAEPPLPQRAPDAPPVSQSDPQTPSERRVARARAVLERHCARCHDARNLKRPLPAAGIANILDLEAIARRRDLVRPGYPEGSPLYVSMVTRHMPFDVLQEFTPGEEPTAAEIADVSAWIAGLAEPAACSAAPSLASEVAQSIRRDLETLEAHARKGRRYISLVGLASNCEDNQSLEAYAQAATKLLNLLSRAAEPIRPQPVGEGGLLLAFDLADLGWSASVWDWLISLAPPPGVEVSAQSEAESEWKALLLPASWLAYQSMDAGVYARLLGLPSGLSAVKSAYGTATGPDWQAQTYRLTTSSVTGSPRALIRVQTADGRPLWLAEDVAASGETDATDGAGRLLQTRAILPLSNGFPGFALFNRDGSPRSSVHGAALPDELAHAGAGSAGLGCLACHGGGMAEFETGQETRQAAPGDWQVRRDNAAFQVAQRAAGLQPGLTIDGYEPVTALAHQYVRDLDLRTAATEMGQPAAELEQSLLSVEGPLQPVARRLLQSLVTRAEFERLRGQIRPRLDRETPASTAAPAIAAPSDNRVRLSLWTEQAGYSEGDSLVLHAASSMPCHLTLISVDGSGDSLVVFPNEFQEQNLLEPGKTVSVPAADSGFRLRVDEPGGEMIVGICMAGERDSPPGIHADFELQPFTLLGDWHRHIDQSLEADARERRRAGKGAGKTTRRTPRRRGRTTRRFPERPDKRPLEQDWALLVIPALSGAASAAGTPASSANPPVSRESDRR